MSVSPQMRRRPPARDDSDVELAQWVTAARSGNADAFGWIWVRLSPRVNGYLRTRGARSPDDLTSEIFLAAFTSIGRFDGSASDFRSWLFTIAHHKYVDDLRRRTDVDEYTAESDPRTSDSAEVSALAAVVDRNVRAMLDMLTPEQREVLLLRTVGDLSIEQVATVTGRSAGAVKQLYRRAIATCGRAADGPATSAEQWLPDVRSRSSSRVRSVDDRSSGLGMPVTSAAIKTMTEL